MARKRAVSLTPPQPLRDTGDCTPTKAHCACPAFPATPPATGCGPSSTGSSQRGANPAAAPNQQASHSPTARRRLSPREQCIGAVQPSPIPALEPVRPRSGRQRTHNDHTRVAPHAWTTPYLFPVGETVSCPLQLTEQR
jgi:hypothetical protein